MCEKWSAPGNKLIKIIKNMNAVVVTSINSPTKSVQEFASINNLQLYVVGDKKTPTNWKYPGVIYLSPADQEADQYEISNRLPFNHYSRKMIGYLHAINDGADFIIDTDDDNIPYENYSFPVFSGSFNTIIDKNNDFVNIYELFTEMKIWPRGLPLDLINKKTINTEKLKQQNSEIGIWQGLADNDPDVDAIYRLTSDIPCNFEKRAPVVLEEGIVCPFNTQNTKIRKELFPLLYLPSTVTFRYTDILRGLVAQPIMWLYNYKLGFSEATVFQERNPHNYFKDFLSEIPMYQTTRDVVDVVKRSLDPDVSINENLIKAYEALKEINVVEKEEIELLNCWLLDLKQIQK